MGWPMKTRSVKSCGTQVARANELDPSYLCWLLSGKARNQNDSWICHLLIGRPTCMFLRNLSIIEIQARASYWMGAINRTDERTREKMNTEAII
jgi:hypothetical protein